MASPPACPNPTDLWLDLLDRLSGDTVAVPQVPILTLLSLRKSAAFACRGFWTLFASCLPASVETYGHLGSPSMRYLRTLSDVASARSLALTRGSFPASAHRELSVALVQSQGYVYRSCALFLAKASALPVLPGADTTYLD
jgi:hypothetical protein